MTEHTLSQLLMTSTGVPNVTIGLDVADCASELCALDAAGTVVETGRVATTLAALERRFAAIAPVRIVLETGTHSPWMSRALAGWGHEVIVANARRGKLIAHNHAKSDKVDAELLARLGRVDPALLAPVHHRGADAQAALGVLRTRDAVVRARSRMISHVRDSVKSIGGRLPAGSAESFPRQAARALPAELAGHLSPVLTTIAQLTTQIRQYDRDLEQLVATTYAEAQPLMGISGVGPVTALCFVLTLDNPGRFANARAVASYLGLCPRKDATGQRDPECHITKCGDRLLRRLLVGSAQYILGPFGPDTDLRRWGAALAARGRKAAKKRAVVAVARKLAVVLFHLWKTQEAYVANRTTRQRRATT